MIEYGIAVRVMKIIEKILCLTILKKKNCWNFINAIEQISKEHFENDDANWLLTQGLIKNINDLDYQIRVLNTVKPLFFVDFAIF